jgi:hypothetical protein
MSNTVPNTVVTFMQSVTSEIINPIIGIIFAVALLYFLWGLMTFIFAAGDTSKMTEGKQHMLWGTIGMVVMISVGAILALGLATIGVSSSDLPDQLNSVR